MFQSLKTLLLIPKIIHSSKLSPKFSKRHHSSLQKLDYQYLNNLKFNFPSMLASPQKNINSPSPSSSPALQKNPSQRTSSRFNQIFRNQPHHREKEIIFRAISPFLHLLIAWNSPRSPSVKSVPADTRLNTAERVTERERVPSMEYTSEGIHETRGPRNWFRL